MTTVLLIVTRIRRWLAPITAGLNTLAAEGKLGVPIAELARHFLHMHVNRMARSEPRAQELVLYDLLTRHYASRAARQRRPGPPS